jgi:hypothetical protein
MHDQGQAPCRRRALNQWRQSQSVKDAHEHMSKSYVITNVIESAPLLLVTDRPIIPPKGFINCDKCGKTIKEKGIGPHKRFCK